MRQAAARKTGLARTSAGSSARVIQPCQLTEPKSSPGATRSESQTVSQPMNNR